MESRVFHATETQRHSAASPQPKKAARRGDRETPATRCASRKASRAEKNFTVSSTESQRKQFYGPLCVSVSLWHEAPIEDSKINGDEISFTAQRPFSKLVYKGKIAGGEIKLTVQFEGTGPFRRQSVHARRAGPCVCGFREAGEAHKAIVELKELLNRRYVSPFDIAVIYAGLGDKEQAFARLEKAYKDHSWGLVRLKIDPRLDSLRGDLRYRDLLRRMGLAP